MRAEANRENRPSRARRAAAALAVLAAMLASAAYGFLVREKHLFPYRLLKSVRGEVRSSLGRSHGASRERAEHSASTSTDAPNSLEAIDRIANLPYLRGYKAAAGGGGVRVHDQALSQDGLNFFTSRHAPVAILMDMDGRVVKTWTADARKAFSEFPRSKPPARPHFLRDAALLPDGGIIAIFDEIGVVRLDAGSRLQWAWPGRVHHDLYVSESGSVWAILHENRIVTQFRSDEPVMDDDLVEISPQGKLLRRMSLIECFQRSSYAPLLDSLRPSAGSGDIFHTNSVVPLDGRLAGRSPAFARGNLLVSLKLLNAVAVVDPGAGRVVWALTGQWHAQHSAQSLGNGHMLLFDNFGTMRMASRALEFDPFTQKILWSFGGRPHENLLSTTAGWVERLSGGNTLITESNLGRVLEVTPDNRVVWEFVNPNRVGEKKDLVAVVNSMSRVPRNLGFLGHRNQESPSQPEDESSP